MVSVASHIANGQGRIGGKFLLDPEGICNDSRRVHVRLDASGHEKSIRRRWGHWIYWKVEIGDGARSYRVRGIEWGILVRPVAQRVLQIVVHAEPSANDGLAAKGAPRQPDSWLRQEFGAVNSEQRISNVRLRRNHATRERIVCRSPVSFIPSSAEFIAETQ